MTSTKHDLFEEASLSRKKYFGETNSLFWLC